MAKGFKTDKKIENAPIVFESSLDQQIEEQLNVVKQNLNYKEIKEHLATDISYLDKNAVSGQLAYIAKAKQSAYELYILACRAREAFRREYNTKMWYWRKEFEENTGIKPTKSWAGYETQFNEWLSAEKGDEYWLMHNKLLRLREQRNLFEQLSYNLRDKEYDLRELIKNFI